MNKDSLVQSLLVTLCVLGLLGLNLSNAQDDDEDGGLTIDNLSNTFDFKKLGGMAGRLAPYGDDLMGDLIDKNTGGITFEHTDVSIPGNSGLEVALRRKLGQGATPFTPFQHGFGDWQIDLPVAYAIFGSDPYNYNPPQFSDGCLNNLGDLTKTLYVTANGGQATAVVHPGQHTDGTVLSVPGKGLSSFKGPFQTLSDPKANWVSGDRTTDHAGRCATVAIAPDGTKYKFGRHVFRIAKSYIFPVQYNTNHVGRPGLVKTQLYVNRKYAVYLITEVEDVNGNWVRYDYTNDSRAELTRIYSNDGRDIRVYYDSAVPNPYSRNSRRVTHVTANNRTWNYQYAQNSGGTIDHLYKVTLPDGRYWSLGDSDSGMWEMIYEPHDNYKCLPYDVSFSMKHPDGAIGTFRLLETRHIKGATHLGYYTDAWDHYMQPMNIPFVTDNSECNGTTFFPRWHRPDGWPIYQAMSIASKTISGAGLPTATWDFEYRNYSSGSLDQTWTRVTGPDGTERTYTYQAVGDDHGLLKRIDVSAGETITYTHDLAEPDVSGCVAGGEYGDTSGMCAVYKKRPVTVQIQQRDGDTYTTEKTYNKYSSGNFVDYGYPNKVSRYSTVSGSTAPRETVTTYEHKTAYNVIGLPKTVVQNGREMATYAYDSLGRKTSQTRYEQPEASFTYHTVDPYKGALATATDALGRQILATNYKRGVPQDIRRTDNEWIYVTVDDNGWMMSSEDAMGRTTYYTRDNMGRLTLINPPGSWANTSISYDFGGGGVVQTITRGQSRETITYDKLYRPILERTQALDTGWTSYVNTSYFPAGQVKFVSQPSTNPNESKGIDYTYDGLGRIYQEQENVSPYATTKHRYYSQNRHRIYDPSGAFTQYYSYGYDGPGGNDYRAIYKYANSAWQQYTYLYKNVHGQMTRLRQWGNSNGYSVNKSQYFYYDAQQRLCRHYVPEHGATKYQYDVAGQMTAYAKGQSNSGCGDVPSSSAKVSLTYDALGHPKLTNFSDAGTPDISRTYDLNGNVKTVARGGVNWSYNYNDINLLTNEYLDVDGRSYDLAYYYNNSGHLNRKILPSGRNVYITPDGLGRARTIVNNSSFLASNIGYHANGSVSAMSHGNGQYFTQTLNSRLFPQRLLSYKGSQKAIDQTFGYDARGKVTSITDGAVSGNNRTYGYDGLGRLISASGPWGTGSYTYDALDNIRQKRLGSRTVDLTYDGYNRVSQSADTGPSGTRALAYDARGNVTTLGSMAFNYDYSDQPSTVSGTASGNYKYDGNLKRVKSVVNGKTIYNVYDFGGKLVHIDAVTDNKKTDHVSGPNGALARITDSAVTYLHPNHLGSAQSGTNTSGNVVWREKYTPFGEELNGQAANDDQAGFTGHIKDKATGLNYMQARYYDPVIGRFLSVDPVTFRQSGKPSHFNRYGYSFNDPVNMMDPDGRDPMFAMDVHQAFNGPMSQAEIDARIQGGNDFIAGVYDFFIADGVETVTSAAQGDFKAAAISATMAVVKPAKIADKVRDISNALPKPPRGPGSVPKSERDPKRTFSSNEREAKRAEQGGECANGCGTEIDASNSNGHHVERHADGGTTTPDNHAEVCIPCHKDLHSPDG